MKATICPFARHLFFLVFVATLAAPTLHGQSALDGFDPNANGTVRVVVLQPDGKILIGGDFTSLAPNGGAPVSRTNIARLNPDGTLDTAFNPNANGFPLCIAVQADGKVLVGGVFTTIGGQARNRIARLDPTTGLADSFDPNPNASGVVYSIATQADGKILVGGDFTSIGGQNRSRMARLDPVTGLADSFDPSANALVFCLAVQADGRILAGGNFNGANSIGGQTRNRIARLDPVTGLADAFNPNANGLVNCFAMQADGKILVGGAFSGASSIGGQSRNRIARLDPDTGLADSFNPNANSSVAAIAVQADGQILVGGNFTSIGGQTRTNIARLNPVTGLADAFKPDANGFVNSSSIVVQADGKILVGGGFLVIGGQVHHYIARLETEGRADNTIGGSPGIVGNRIFALAVQPDGKILIGGGFSSVQGTARNNIARLNTDGTLDTAFNPNANNEVLAIALQVDGKILVGGVFHGVNSIGGQSREFIARLDPVTGAADSFDPRANASVEALAVQADGKILVGGDFNGFGSIGGAARNGIARLDSITGAADLFNPGASAYVTSIAVQTDGKILAGGVFSEIGGQIRSGIARLDPITGAADSFNPNAVSIGAIMLQADGKVLASGDFTAIGGQMRQHFARLDPNTGLADAFDPHPDFYVTSIAGQSDGKILAVGTFTQIGGANRSRIARLDAATGAADSFFSAPNASVYGTAVQPDGKILVCGLFNAFTEGLSGIGRPLFARLSNPTAALQNLFATRTTITWTRGGSSPQFTRATFEFSTDNVSYTPLGNGTMTGSDWGLTGLNLPVAQNIYIRARGFYRSGNQNGSESIQESVRNAFIPASPLLNIRLSANTNVVLSWATNFAGFTLESNTNLSTNVWSVVAPAPSVSGTNNVVTNAATEVQKFYRLSKQ